VKNITVSVPDDVHRAARIAAAEQGTSVSALVARHLEALASGEASAPGDRLELVRAIEEIRRRCDAVLPEDQVGRQPGGGAPAAEL
jgi:plasmid stability protein